MSQTVTTPGANVICRPTAIKEELQQRRKNRLMGYLHKGLPTLPSYLLDLNALLSKQTVDLKKVSKVIRTDPSLSAQVLRLCNSALFGLRRRVLGIEQAAVLLGTERLRTLVLTCAVMQFAGKHVPVKSLLAFWEHSFMAALLSERIARVVEYPETEQAYLGGLLHDIGQLPLWMLVMEEEKRQRELPPDNWPDNVVTEREFFGMDHGKVGRWLAVSWNFMPSFMDVFEHHHNPEQAQHDPYLVALVAATDKFLDTQVVPEARQPGQPEATEPTTPTPSSGAPTPAEAAEEPPYLAQCFPTLAPEERLQVLAALRTEYTHQIPLVQLGIAAVMPGTGGR
jgi:putative nucleotidyltransferase with HDIG domain